MRRALLLAGSVALAAGAQAQEAQHPVEGLWGFELVDDMTCAANPVKIDLTEDGGSSSSPGRRRCSIPTAPRMTA